MRVKTLQVHWHQKQPIFSADFHASGRLATAGGDAAVRIWRFDMSAQQPALPQLVYLATLSRHETPVNVVRWHPREELLASSGDDGMIFVWRRGGAAGASGAGAFGGAEESDEGAQEAWHVHAQMRRAREVCDLSWSPSGRYMVTGSLDNCARIWDVAAGQCIQELTHHAHFVQGVAWSPLDDYIATQSSDRSVICYKLAYSATDPGTLKEAVLHTKSERTDIPDAAESLAAGKTDAPRTTDDNTENVAPNGAAGAASWQQSTMRIFQDESLTTFARRLSFSPDGLLLLAPCGLLKTIRAGEDKLVSRNVLWTYLSRALQSGPMFCTPQFKRAPVVVRFSPRRYAPRTVRPAQPIPLILPYRLVYAVATLDAIHVFDTESALPLATVSQLHYATFTDLAWSADGTMLLAASADGFCSLIVFDGAAVESGGTHELGVPLPSESDVAAPFTPVVAEAAPPPPPAPVINMLQPRRKVC